MVQNNMVLIYNYKVSISYVYFEVFALGENMGDGVEMG